jgi:large subunit ribosomal protein L4
MTEEEKKEMDKEAEEAAGEQEAEAAETETEDKAEGSGAEESADEGAGEEPAAAEEAAAADESAEKPKPKKARKTKAKAGSAAISVKALAEKDYKLDPDVFGTEPSTGLLHEVVRAEAAAERQGSASTKTRAQVRGGGVKPWRQKGTGRARAGSNRMPHWTGGGVVFGPSPRSYRFKVNRKVRGKALRMALSARAREGELKVVESLAFKEPRTADAAAALEELEVSYPLLVLLDASDKNAELSFRNLPEVGVSMTGELSVTDILWARTLLVTRPALENLNKLGGKQ